MIFAQFVVRLPEPLADAVVGEAVRCSSRTSDVIAEALIESFPAFVARRTGEDLLGGQSAQRSES